MPIKLANAVNFSHLPRCPTCDADILPYGTHEPLAADESGRVYCRLHGSEVEPSYPRILDEYREERMARRLAALDELGKMDFNEEGAESIQP
jgi:hypothetical protein